MAAAFARERDARYCMELASGSIDAVIDYTLRPIISEGGYVQMVVLEASFDDPRVSSHLETAMRGAHGVPMSAGAVTTAQAV